MAKALNKDRMIVSKIAFVVAVLVMLFTRETFARDSIIHSILDVAGVVLTTICALGRVYCTAFLGGHKNTSLVTQGPFSVVRNPLYVFSFIGITGVALMSNHIVLIVGIPVLFFVMYNSLVAREEAFLTQAFGKEYQDYCMHTPRFWPNFKRYNAAEALTMSPRLLWYAFRDNIAWVIPYCAFALIEKIHFIL